MLPVVRAAKDMKTNVLENKQGKLYKADKGAELCKSL
jgi:hypothetical protein